MNGSQRNGMFPHGGTFIARVVFIVLLLLVSCGVLFASLKITTAEYVTSLEWVQKTFAGVGNLWGTKLMSFTVYNDDSGNNSLKLFVVSDTGNTGEAQFYFGSSGNERQYKGYGGYYLYDMNGTMIFNFQNAGSATRFDLKKQESVTFEVWFVAWRYEWNVPNPPPLSTANTVTLGNVPRIAAAESNGNIDNPNNVGTTIPALDFPNMTGTNSRFPVIGGGGTTSGKNPGEVVIGPGGGTSPNIWEYGIDTQEKHVDLSALKSGREIEVANITARRISGGASEQGTVTVRFSPNDFIFYDSVRKNPSFGYTLDFGTQRIDSGNSSVVWDGLSPLDMNKMLIKIRFGGMLNEYQTLDDLPAGTYTSTVRIEFITGT